jgi:hypothetical protein
MDTDSGSDAGGSTGRFTNGWLVSPAAIRTGVTVGAGCAPAT